MRVTVFFYGSYMNRSVLSKVNIAPGEMDVARLGGYDITIEPLANLVPSESGFAYGLVAELTHEELERLYDHAEHVLGEKYFPVPVLVERLGGAFHPALCYIAPAIARAKADPEYVGRIVAPARESGFPAWYIDRLESYR